MIRLLSGRERLEGDVRHLRQGLDMTGLDIRSPSDLPSFPIASAHSLYQDIVAPVEDLISGARHVIVVPDGPLQEIPFGVLVTEQAEPMDLEDYPEVSWLARRYATSVLPSVSSLRVLRTFAHGALAAAPFIGFGDPLLDGNAGSVRGVDPAGLFRGELADVDAVRRLPPLPESADELRAMAHALGAGDDVLYLADRAIEAQVRGAPLGEFRVVAFATHALVAGALRGLAKPALVLTPPPKASEADDGPVTVPEIAKLRLNAEWVILSACDTAAEDGTPGAEGLSGFARAFFYAGTRALLVSHWPVFSKPAVALTTGAIAALAEEPGLGRAEALRRAQLALMENDAEPYLAHPMFWAPFVVVGEGGAGH